MNDDYYNFDVENQKREKENKYAAAFLKNKNEAIFCC